MNSPVRRLPKPVAVLAALLLVSPLASAQDAAEMKPIREAFPRKSEGCFVRAYDARHLAAHPDQGVARIRLARLAPERKLEDIDGPEAPTVALRLLLTTRTGGRGAEALACTARLESAGGQRPFLTCASACHRGAVDLTPLGPDSVRLTIGGQVMGRFVPDALGVGATCASDAGVVWLGDSEGDRTFLLIRAPLEACR